MNNRHKPLLRAALAVSLLATALSWSATTPALGAQAAAPPTVKNKVYAGYQGWFNAAGDGSPLNNWRHWSRGTQPSPGNQTFELYPDMSKYPASARYQTGYAALGNGQPATLFSSYPTAVVDQHFQWMSQHGIDGAAIQRFGSDVATPGSANAQVRNTITSRARDAAERNGRGFYVEYDVSGLTDANVEQVLTRDWTDVVTGQLHLTDSPAYARENGKPVVEIWGFGFPDRPGTAAQAERIVRWFKDRGLYVIGGVPREWRTGGGSKPGFAPVYRAFDMISPWMVGYVGDTNGLLTGDRDALNATGQAYQPVIYPGFAWSNWNGGARNMIPRRSGDFMWEQATSVRRAGVPQAFIAMFDEYDEGTALAPGAEDSSQVPTNQYFLTNSADGKYVSSDFYLRLAGRATRMITGLDPLVTTVPIPLSAGPVFFRTSVEQGTDAQPTWTNTPGGGGTTNVTGQSLAIATGEDNQIGSSALRIRGSAASTAASHAYFQVFDVNIPVTAATKLQYSFLPKDAGGRNVAVDFAMTDGTTLRDSSATTTTGADMHPGTAKGTVGSWTRIQSDFGSALNGKTIDKILVGYDRSGTAGAFTAYIDDLTVTNS
ncbi:glycoside hydrolase family 71/99-like protein [Streptosporangium sp. NBC_01495]|uniref:glycoside hydrolase family 71/99-like protein n=1 Tax=Streptosporangium sp. NBC_01495 TaxID=2903899 RepID=UPI002E2FE641|nr:glycoside hydrolase family 71/99-like protein [Streptosporangium sp. NBC_01495]